MGFSIVTGHTGEAHITSYQDAVRNSLMTGKRKYILDVGDSLDITSSRYDGTTFVTTIGSGYVINQGRLMGIELGEYEELSMSTASVNTKRLICIVARYRKDIPTGIESSALTVVYGEEVPSDETPELPELYDNDLLDESQYVDDVLLHVLEATGPAIYIDDNYEQYPSLARIWSHTGWITDAIVDSYHIPKCNMRVAGNMVYLNGFEYVSLSDSGYVTHTWNGYSYRGYVLAFIDDAYARFRPNRPIYKYVPYIIDGETTPAEVADIQVLSITILPDGYIMANPLRYNGDSRLNSHYFRMVYDELNWFID